MRNAPVRTLPSIGFLTSRASSYPAATIAWPPSTFSPALGNGMSPGFAGRWIVP